MPFGTRVGVWLRFVLWLRASSFRVRVAVGIRGLRTTWTPFWAALVVVRARTRVGVLDRVADMASRLGTQQMKNS